MYGGGDRGRVGLHSTHHLLDHCPHIWEGVQLTDEAIGLRRRREGEREGGREGGEREGGRREKEGEREEGGKEEGGREEGRREEKVVKGREKDC